MVLDPASGLLFVEVKGGSLEFDPDRMEWRRVLPNGEGRLLGKDPFEQARQSMHEIVDRIRGELPGSREQLPFTYGYAVAFPDCRYSGSLPASIVPDQVLDAAKCADLRQGIERSGSICGAVPIRSKSLWRRCSCAARRCAAASSARW